MKTSFLAFFAIIAASAVASVEVASGASPVMIAEERNLEVAAFEAAEADQAAEARK
ncbi:hypothetical protein AeNC1_018341, partial [Aphanomyces euteiches]